MSTTILATDPGKFKAAAHVKRLPPIPPAPALSYNAPRTPRPGRGSGVRPGPQGGDAIGVRR
jgi:hypothetical protein